MAEQEERTVDELVQELQRELSSTGVSLTNDEVRKALQEGNYLVRQFEFYQVRGQVETPAPRMQVKEFLLNHFRPPQEVDSFQIEDEREASGAGVPFAVRPYAEALERGTAPPTTKEATASFGLGGLPAEPGAAAPRTAPSPLPSEALPSAASLEERVGGASPSGGAPPDYRAQRMELRRQYVEGVERLRKEGGHTYSEEGTSVVDLIVRYLTSLEEENPQLSLWGKDDHSARKTTCNNFTNDVLTDNLLDSTPVFDLLEEIAAWYRGLREEDLQDRSLNHITEMFSANLMGGNGATGAPWLIKPFYEHTFQKCKGYLARPKEERSGYRRALIHYICLESPEAQAYLEKLKQEIVPPAPAEVPAEKKEEATESAPAAPRTTPPPLPSQAVSPRKGVRAATPSNDLQAVQGEVETKPVVPPASLDQTQVTAKVIEHEVRTADYAREKNGALDNLRQWKQGSLSVDRGQPHFYQYLELLGHEHPDLVLPGLTNDKERQEFIRRFFSDTVELRGESGRGIPLSYLKALDTLVARAGTELASHFAERLADLYADLPEDKVDEYLEGGWKRLDVYNNLPEEQKTPERWKSEIEDYFNTKSGTEGSTILRRMRTAYHRELIAQKRDSTKQVRDLEQRLKEEQRKPASGSGRWSERVLFFGLSFALSVAAVGGYLGNLHTKKMNEADRAYAQLQQEAKVLREGPNGTAWQAREQEWEKKYAAVERRKNEAERIEREYNPLVEKHTALQNELADLKKKGGRPVEMPEMLMEWGERIRKYADNPEKLRELGIEFNRMLSGSGVRLPTGGCGGYLRSLYRLMGGPDNEQIRQKFVDSSRGACTDQMNGHYIRF